MFSERAIAWLEDIRLNINDIRQYVGDIDENAFSADKQKRDAVERCLERITEAVARLERSSIDLEALEPEIPWRTIRSLGNRLRHAYETINPERIWLIISDDLGPLDEAAQRLLNRGD